jgi:hypothetical protein
MKKPKPLSYAEKAKRLRDFGFNVSLKSGHRQTPQQKSAVTRLFKAHSNFLSPRKGTSPTDFIPASGSKLRQARKIVSSKSITPGGFFIQIPKGVRKRDYSVKIENGVIVEKIRGKQNDRIVPLNSKDVAIDPPGAFRKAAERELRKMKGKKPVAAQLMVNGFTGKRVVSLKQLLNYLEHSPQFLTSVEDIGDDDFEDTFQIKFIYAKSRKPKKAQRKAVRGRGHRN